MIELAIPFQDRYSELAQFEVAFIVALIATSLSLVFVLATHASQRLRLHRKDEEKLVTLGNRLGLVGSSVLAVAIIAAVLMLMSFLLGATIGIATAASTATFVAVAWYGCTLRP